MSSNLELQDAAVLPQGFRATGVHCGVKPDTLDLALFVSDTPAEGAGMFTTNRVPAACVDLCRERLAGGGTYRAIVVNSGNANACTGAQGRSDAAAMAIAAAASLGIGPMEVLVSSTGTIGIPLPMECITRGITEAAASVTGDGGSSAVRAIMTTDTLPKHLTTTLVAGDRAVRVTGVAKGAGMIHPGMATMLTYLFTDAAVEPAALLSCLAESVRESFNRITVDGDRSTNDSVIFLANGMAGNRPLKPGDPGWEGFREAVDQIALGLALKIVRDGEGSSRLVTVQVRGAADAEDADRVARTVGNSLLIKTSWAGGDPNWGRVLCAVGYAGAAIRPERVDVMYDDVPAVRGGEAAGTEPHALRAVTAQPAFTLTIDLHEGEGVGTVYACDTTEAYVKINVEE